MLRGNEIYPALGLYALILLLFRTNLKTRTAGTRKWVRQKRSHHAGDEDAAVGIEVGHVEFALGAGWVAGVVLPGPSETKSVSSEPASDGLFHG